MTKIKILAADEIKKIAAGEVVERPATIVKELVENSLDAGAQSIDIHVCDGGRSVIRVIDTGCGMSHEDAHLACSAHATSKIVTVDDLQALNTYGFRGEALASIAAVSTLTLVTRDEFNSAGIKLTVANGVLVGECETACQQGTDITIEHLFDNIPARKKFLKTAETELRAIVTLFQSFVLAHKTVHFKLFHEDFLVHNCPPVDGIQARFTQLWDHYLADQLLPVLFEDTTIGISGEGMISCPQYLRYNTSQIFLLVNNRWIKNLSLTRALLRGYSGALPQGRYPAAALLISVDPMLIDVNIHPRKEEVKFVHEHKIEQLVQQAVKHALEQVFSQYGYTKSPLVVAQQPDLPAWPITNSNNSVVEPVFTPSCVLKDREFHESVPEEQFVEQSRLVATRSYRFVGQCFKTYLVLEKDEELVFIDQHAAHERILYELMVKNRTHVQSIALLFPQLVPVSKSALVLLAQQVELLAQYGILGDCMGDDRFVIRQVPVYLKHINLIELIHDLVTFLQDTDAQEPSFLEKISERLCVQMACKAAVKAGDELSQEKIYEILDKLETIDNRSTCPHGRPTIWSLRKHELEKKFRRDYGK